MKNKLLLVALLTLGLASCNETGPSENSKPNATTTMQMWTVTLDLNYEGGGVYKTFTVESKAEGTNIKSQLQEAKPTRDGYTFDSWYHDTYTKVEWVYSRDLVLADTTLYAGWISNSVEPDDPATPGTTTSTVEPTTSTSSPEPSTTVTPTTTVVEPTTTVEPETTSTTLEPSTGEEIIEPTTPSTSIVTPTTPVEENHEVVFNFTLPSWDPVAENPKIYYWGTNEAGTHMENTVNWDDASDTGGAMTKVEGNDYTYITSLSKGESITGVIVMFYQAGVRKQSIDLTTYTIVEGGIYNIMFVGAPWSGDKFTATIEKVN